MKLFKYPRTQHIYGSRLQPGDKDLKAVPIDQLYDSYLVIEEKMDGANSGISFINGELFLQSRGHYLIGGQREKHFNLLKTWANCHKSYLWNILGNRYVMFGEWLYAKHTIYYNNLPHYFMEFDILDKETGDWLSTDRRLEILKDDIIISVAVLETGYGKEYTKDKLNDLSHSKSLFIEKNNFDSLERYCYKNNLNFEQIKLETDPYFYKEGLYIKEESDGKVVGRYKWVRKSFLTSVFESNSHWLSRPIIPNQLQLGVNIF